MLACLVLVALAGPQSSPQGDLLFADFEGADYGAWIAEGDAFGAGPAHGTLPGQMEVTGFRGRGLVNSFLHGDRATGRLLSPEFTITRGSVCFLVGGGGHPGATCMNLLVDGKVVRTVTGPNTEPGGSERLEAAGWDVRDLRGRVARIEIVDRATGGWGHVNVDEIVFTDRPPPRAPEKRKDVTRTIPLTQRFLHLPVRTGAHKHRMAVEVAGQVVREFEIELSPEPEWYAHLDVSAWLGKEATLRVDWLFEGDRALERVALADALWDVDHLHRESSRPRIHWSPPRGWTNDPNGLVWSNGEYHLFYQHNPYGWAWGNMHWGHAVSRDLVHWQDLPVAIAPRTFGDWVYSGSAVVAANDLLVAAFTSTGRGECLARSTDHGRTWSECEGNPVLRHEGRDPRLLWHAPTSRWVMAVYDEYEGKRTIAFHTSPDLRTWTFRSRIEGFYECPDLFELPVDGDPAKRKWVLTAASSEYRIGSFDGAVFTPETPLLPGHRGKGFYAAQTFSNEPQGRVVQIGWLQAETPGMPFNQAMSLPLVLSLRGTAAGPRLRWQPAPELAELRQTARSVARSVSGDATLLSAIGDAIEVRATLTPGSSRECGLDLGGIRVAWESERGELVVAGHRTPVALRDGKLALVVFTDRNAVEVFADDGLVYVPVVLPAGITRSATLTAFARGGEMQVACEIAELTGIW